MGNDDDKGGRASKSDEKAPSHTTDDARSGTSSGKSSATAGAADAAARRMAHAGKQAREHHDAKPPLWLVEKDGHLAASETDATVVGLSFGGGWLVATSGAKPVSLQAATVGSLHGSRDASMVEMRTAVGGDGSWKLGDHSVGMLVTGDGASAQVLGEIATGSGKSWNVHGRHGAKDKLPAELAKVIEENDRLVIGDHFYAWMSYPTGSGAENPAGWASTSHSKEDVDGKAAKFRTDAEQLPEPLRTEVLSHIETIAVVSSVEGGYDDTSGQVADTSGSLGIFQWARSRDPSKGADSIDKFFVRMEKRAKAAEEKVKKKEQPSAEELAASTAWVQAQKMGIGVSGGKTTVTHGKDVRAAGGLDLELAAAGSTGLDDSYQVSQALRGSRYVDKALEKKRANKPKKESVADEKKEVVALLDGVIEQLATAIRDVLASDLVTKDAPEKLALETQLAALEKKEEGKKAGAQPEDDAAKLAALEKEIKDKAQRVHAADPVLRHVIDHKIKKAPLMTETAAMRQYQLVAALDWIKDFQANAVFPSYEAYRSHVLPPMSMDSKSAALSHDGRKLHLASDGGSTVGDHLKSEKAVAEMAMLGVNRPAYVATALWAALQSGDVNAAVKTNLATIFGAVEALESKSGAESPSKNEKKHAAKKGEITESSLQALLASPAPEHQAEADAAAKAMAELKGILWPAAGKEDEGQLIVRFRAEAMRIYNTNESGDANDNNRVGRFATVELIDWNAVEAAKAKQ